MRLPVYLNLAVAQQGHIFKEHSTSMRASRYLYDAFKNLSQVHVYLIDIYRHDIGQAAESQETV